MEAFRHDFLLLFLRSYFNDKCPERIIACKSASNARTQTSPLAGGFPFIHSHRKWARSVRHYMSPEFNVAISVGMHRQKPKLAHMPTNVNQYLHSITVSMYLSAGVDWPSGEPVPGGLAANLARCPAFIYFLYNLLLLFYIVVVVFVAYRMY